MLLALSRGLQLVGLFLLPLAMAMQLHGMRLGNMLLMAVAGAVVFYLGYQLQQRERR